MLEVFHTLRGHPVLDDSDFILRRRLQTNKGGGWGTKIKETGQSRDGLESDGGMTAQNSLADPFCPCLFGIDQKIAIQQLHKPRRLGISLLGKHCTEAGCEKTVKDGIVAGSQRHTDLEAFGG